MKNLHPLLVAATLSMNASHPLAAFEESAPALGINLAGAEFGGEFPGTYGKTYTYPTARELDYYRARGIELIRLPFRWERLHPRLMEPLDPEELKRMDAVIDEIELRGMRLVPDMHNYARYITEGQNLEIGTEKIPRAAYADVWERLAAHLKDRDCLWAYGIMNEPHDMGPYTWKESAQVAIDAIRKHDQRHPILVPGDAWSSARRWPEASADLIALKDPAGKLYFEAHSYFDKEGSGVYANGYDEDGLHPDLGVERLRPFVEWCRQHQVRGFIGEYGVPDNDPRWLEVLDRALAYLQENGVSGAYWAGGPWWGPYFLATEQRPDHREAPQMAVLGKYGGAPATGHWRSFTWFGDLIGNGAQGGELVESKSEGTVLESSIEGGAVSLQFQVPPGGFGRGGLRIPGGVDLAGNFDREHVLRFRVRGEAAATVELHLVTADGKESARVKLPVEPREEWRNVRIPLRQFKNADCDGRRRIESIAWHCLPADGVKRRLELDDIVIEAPDQEAPRIKLRVKAGPGRAAEVTAMADSDVVLVQFHVNGARVTALEQPPFTTTIPLPIAGEYRLTAIAFDRHGNPARSQVERFISQ